MAEEPLELAGSRAQKIVEIKNPFDESFTEVATRLKGLIELHNSILRADDTTTKFSVETGSCSRFLFNTDSVMQKEMVLFLRREIQEEIDILNAKGIVNIQIIGLN